MDEKQLPGEPLNEWVCFFSGSAFDRSLLEEGFLFQPAYPVPLRLALWLEYFLMADQDRLKEKWAHLTLEEQAALGIALLKCYLFQPLFLRLFREGGSQIKKPVLISGKTGKLLQVEVESGTAPKIRFFYPLAHHRLWPVLLTVLKEALFSSEEVFKRLQPELTLSSSSRLETIRRRAETLSTFFSTWQGEGASPGERASEQTDLEKKAPLPIHDIPAKISEVTHPESTDDPIRSAPESQDILPVPPKSPQKKKKKKSSNDQLKLF